MVEDCVVSELKIAIIIGKEEWKMRRKWAQKWKNRVEWSLLEEYLLVRFCVH